MKRFVFALLLLISSRSIAQVAGASYRQNEGSSGVSLEVGVTRSWGIPSCQIGYFLNSYSVGIAATYGARFQIGPLVGLSVKHFGTTGSHWRSQEAHTDVLFNYGAVVRANLMGTDSSAIVSVDYGRYSGFGVGLLFPF